MEIRKVILDRHVLHDGQIVCVLATRLVAAAIWSFKIYSLRLLLYRR